MSESPAYALGFESVTAEPSAVELAVEGSLPHWVDGSLYRNGPGRFETPSGEVQHWFDGLAYLRRFEIEGAADSIRYTGRFLRSEAYRRSEAGEAGAAQFGTGREGGPLRRLRGRLLPETTDNANVNVLEVADSLLAITETPEMTAIDPETLQTRGAFAYTDDVPGQWQCAHPVRDPVRGETVNMLVSFGRTSSYEVVTRQDGATGREGLASIPVDAPSYTHSFALTDRYVVLTEPPFRLDPLDLLLPWRGGEGFVDAFTWEPERGTRFRLIDRNTGAVTASYRSPSMFVFHHVNAVERDGAVVVDLVGFPGDDAVQTLYLDALRDGVEPPRGTLWRIQLPMAGGTPSREALASGLTLPRTNEACLTQAHRYTWAQGRGPETAFADRIVKAGPEGISATWETQGWFCGEPVVIGDPDGAEPDDGVVLVVALDPKAERSVLAVLDAATLDELATANLPHVLPFDFHGQFYPNTGETVSPR
jgi:carotenoid cleavage dioxygenase-like enzyme